VAHADAPKAISFVQAGDASDAIFSEGELTAVETPQQGATRFLASSALSFVPPVATTNAVDSWAIAFTLQGALGFFVGAVLMLNKDDTRVSVGNDTTRPASR
jgi:hypothetical protein